jgi:hypothetical protein
MNRWKIWLGIGIVFVSGIGIGVLGTFYGIHYHIRTMVEEGPGAFNRMVAGHISSQLDLNEEQETAIFGTVTKTHNELWKLKTRNNDKIDEIIRKGIDEMSSHLNPEKQEELKRMHTEFRKMLHSHMSSDS